MFLEVFDFNLFMILEADSSHLLFISFQTFTIGITSLPWCKQTKNLQKISLLLML